ncbi:MAG: phosphoglycerate dehydrogenase [Deltaproteobacteria bacterium]|nr:MAG: phosphoglycerate dehydrogenase [Deltaproteobacteria bacterium]
MSKSKVLITCDLGAAALARFNEVEGIEVLVENIKDVETLAAHAKDVNGIIVRSNVKVTADVINAAKGLKVIGRAGIGVDNIDVNAATKAGVAVVNAPSGNTVTTAEHAVSMMLSMARRIPQASASMKEDKWEKKRFMGTEVRSKVLGVIGAGRIGSTVAGIVKGLRMRVLCYDPFLTAERARDIGVESVDLDTLLANADFITLHTPLTPDTKDLIGGDNLKKVKEGVFIVNCARGPIVNLDDLDEAMETGRVAGAALDVFEVEPPPHHKLFERENVILTPHLGASTVEAQESVALEIADNVISYLTTGVSPNTLNLPSLPAEVFSALEKQMFLAKGLGLLGAQLAEGPISSASIQLKGDRVEEGKDILTAAFLAGLLTPAVGEVNIVNARSIAEERGICVSTATSTELGDFTDIVAVEISGAWGKSSLEGALFNKRDPRLVSLDGFRIDAVPRGEMLLLYNRDVPGVIGAIGKTLGENGTNISGLYNGRESIGGRALTLVNIDAPATDKAKEALSKLDNVISVKCLKL